MKIKEHALNKVWNNYPEALQNNYKITETASVERIIAEMFAVGEFYYYILDTINSTVFNFHENILKMHGLKNYPQHLKEILDLIHPDDIPFVIEAEQMTLEKMKEIGFEHQMNLKNSYCFRMKTADGSYQLFHHQALHIKKDETGRLLQVVNIHTNIHHLTPVNNYIVLVSGIGGRNDFHQMYPKNLPVTTPKPYNLTKRELEVLQLIAKGYSCIEISEKLVLSEHTVRTHRKNILRKTQVNNGSELIRRCIEWGFI